MITTSINAPYELLAFLCNVETMSNFVICFIFISLPDNNKFTSSKSYIVPVLNGYSEHFPIFICPKTVSSSLSVQNASGS